MERTKEGKRAGVRVGPPAPGATKPQTKPQSNRARWKGAVTAATQPDVRNSLLARRRNAERKKADDPVPLADKLQTQIARDFVPEPTGQLAVEQHDDHLLYRYRLFTRAESRLREVTALFKSRSERGDKTLADLQAQLAWARDELYRVEGELGRTPEGVGKVSVGLTRDALKRLMKKYIREIIDHRNKNGNKHMDEASADPEVKDAASVYEIAAIEYFFANQQLQSDRRRAREHPSRPAKYDAILASMMRQGIEEDVAHRQIMAAHDSKLYSMVSTEDDDDTGTTKRDRRRHGLRLAARIKQVGGDGVARVRAMLEQVGLADDDESVEPAESGAPASGREVGGR